MSEAKLDKLLEQQNEVLIRLASLEDFSKRADKQSVRVDQKMDQQDERMRDVEKSLVSLEKIPETLKSMESRLEDLTRLEGRVKTLEDIPHDTKIADLEKRLSQVEKSLAKYVGMASVIAGIIGFIISWIRSLMT